jgi:hypothetical protein
MTSTRLQGKALSLTFGGVEYFADVTSIELTNADSDGSATTFADIAGGGAKTYSFKISAIQSTQTSSFWRFAWDHLNQTIPYRYSVWGNPVPTPDQPHFTGTLYISERPSIGGDAKKGGADYTFDVTWDTVEDEPTLDTGTGTLPVITAISPASKSVGDVVILAGRYFTDATSVKFGTIPAESFVVVSDATLSVVIPADASDLEQVTVVTPGGTSVDFPYAIGADD